MRYYPWANVAILALVAFELLTGYLGLVAGLPDRALYLHAHRLGGFATALVLLWKGQNSLRPFLRRGGGKWAAPRLASLLLAILLVVTLALGIAWSHGRPFAFRSISGVSWHIYAGLALLPVALWHTLRFRRALAARYWAERRSFLRLTGLSLGGLVLWQAGESLSRLLGSLGAGRRFTGSYAAPSLSGNDFPLTSWLNDSPRAIDPATWRLRIEGAVLRPIELAYQELAGERQRLTATLDCTGGWYSTQEWEGISLHRLLERAGPTPRAASVSVVSGTGYYRRFSLAEARGILLATRVGGEVLSHGHGFPLRLVAPGKRGFEWVKWVERIEVHETGKWLQPPLPIQ